MIDLYLLEMFDDSFSCFLLLSAERGREQRESRRERDEFDGDEFHFYQKSTSCFAFPPLPSIFPTSITIASHQDERERERRLLLNESGRSIVV